MKTKLSKLLLLTLCIVLPVSLMMYGCGMTVEDTKVKTYEELTNAISKANAGDRIVLENDLVITQPILVNKDIVLDLNGKTISNTEDIWSDNNWSLITVQAGGKLTLDGNGSVIAKENDCYGIDIRDGASCIINSGFINGNITAVYAYNGSLVVNGGKFAIQQLSPLNADRPYAFVLNCYDKAFSEGQATITVKGGQFENFDPANNYSGEGNLVAEGYKSQLGEDGKTYTVVKA